jgi:LPXTG-motif cell wall-anchored protein
MPVIFWPWYTLIGTLITIGMALALRRRRAVNSW